MRGVSTGDHKCKGDGCENRNKQRARYCPDCKRQMADAIAAVNRVLFPPMTPYTPRVYTIAPFDGGAK